jgi:hypothetical protein
MDYSVTHVSASTGKSTVSKTTYMCNPGSAAVAPPNPLFYYAQRLLDVIIADAPTLRADLLKSDYGAAWSYVLSDRSFSANTLPIKVLPLLLETPVGFQVLGIPPFTSTQMTAFYAAAGADWGQITGGGNPYNPTQWGANPASTPSDAIANSNCQANANDCKYPDLARFAGR